MILGSFFLLTWHHLQRKKDPLIVDHGLRRGLHLIISYLQTTSWKVTILWRFSLGMNDKHFSFSPMAFRALLTRIVSTFG